MDDDDVVDELFDELKPDGEESKKKMDDGKRNLLARAYGLELTTDSTVSISADKQFHIDKLLNDVARLLESTEETGAGGEEEFYVSSRGDLHEARQEVKIPAFQSAFDELVTEGTSAVIAEDAPKPERQLSCFNCEGPHNMNACPEPKNWPKIKRNQTAFALKNEGTPNNGRYHREKDAKMMSKFTPGAISPALREALGLAQDSLPPYIYDMRVMGYPPGYYRQLVQPPTKLVIYRGGSGDEKGDQESEKGLDVSKFVEYPGFNMPMPPGFKDEYYQGNFPPLLAQHLKEAFLADVRGQCGTNNHGTNGHGQETVRVNRVSSIKEHDNRPESTRSINSSSSESLDVLEEKRRKIIAELEGGAEPPSKVRRLDSNNDDECMDSNGPASPDCDNGGGGGDNDNTNNNSMVDLRSPDASDGQFQLPQTTPIHIPLGDSGDDIASSKPSTSQQSQVVDPGTPVHGASRTGSKPLLAEFATGIQEIEHQEETPVRPGCGGFKLLKEFLKKGKRK